MVPKNVLFAIILALGSDFINDISFMNLGPNPNPNWVKWVSCSTDISELRFAKWENTLVPFTGLSQFNIPAQKCYTV